VYKLWVSDKPYFCFVNFHLPEAFFQKLRDQLAKPLPGMEAQNRMSSRVRVSVDDYLSRYPNYKTSAVLLILYPHQGEVYTAIIRRPKYDGTHSGQLALPGGKTEEDDRSFEETALRETHEEVGVILTEKQIIGKLSPVYIPPSNFLVNPFVAVLEQKPFWSIDAREVDSILEIPLRFLFSSEIKSRKRISIGKNQFMDVPCYLLGDDILWGATAMMFAELESLCER
jgi:8-oxo-dGTP pyrophosphatase MutT (NUDIX family)